MWQGGKLYDGEWYSHLIPNKGVANSDENLASLSVCQIGPYKPPDRGNKREDPNALHYC